MYFSLCFFCYQAPNALGGHSGQFSLHLPWSAQEGMSCDGM